MEDSWIEKEPKREWIMSGCLFKLNELGIRELQDTQSCGHCWKELEMGWEYDYCPYCGKGDE